MFWLFTLNCVDIQRRKHVGMFMKYVWLRTHRFLYDFVIIWCFIRIYRLHKRPSTFVCLIKKKLRICIRQHVSRLEKLFIFTHENIFHLFFTCICLMSFFNKSKSLPFRFFMFAKLTDEFRWQFGQTYSSMLSASDWRIPTQRPWNQSWHLSQHM